MNIFRINNKYVAVAIFLMLAVTLRAQDYGALQYMLQKRPANEKFESNRFNEHLFFSAGIGPYSLLTSGDSQDGMGMTAHLFMGKWITPVETAREYYIKAIAANRLEKIGDAIMSIEKALELDPSLLEVAKVDGDIIDLLPEEQKIK